MRTILITFALLAGVGGLKSTAAPAPLAATSYDVVPVTPAYINQLFEQARTNQPVLRAAQARAESAVHGAAAVRTWEDPVFSLGGVTSSSRGSNLREDGDLIYGLDQKLPLWGKAKLARAAQQSEAAVRAADAEMRLVMLRRELAKAVYQAALADRVVALAEQDLTLLDTLLTAAGQRYQVGAGSQVDVLRLQSERAKRTDQLKTETEQRLHDHLVINRLLNRGLHTPLPTLELPPLGPAVPFTDALLAMASARDPNLKVMHQEIKRAEATAQLTKRQRLPDVTLGIEGRQYSGDAGFREGAATLGISLPWFNRKKYRSDLQRDEARVRAAEADLAEAGLAVHEQLHHFTVDLDTAHRRALLYRDEIIPRGEQALAAAQAAWLASRGPFNDVLETRRLLVEGRMEFARAVNEQHQKLSELLFVCGLDEAEKLDAPNLQPDAAKRNPKKG